MLYYEKDEMWERGFHFTFKGILFWVIIIVENGKNNNKIRCSLFIICVILPSSLKSYQCAFTYLGFPSLCCRSGSWCLSATRLWSRNTPGSRTTSVCADSLPTRPMSSGPGSRTRWRSVWTHPKLKWPHYKFRMRPTFKFNHRPVHSCPKFKTVKLSDSSVWWL